MPILAIAQPETAIMPTLAIVPLETAIPATDRQEITIIGQQLILPARITIVLVELPELDIHKITAAPIQLVIGLVLAAITEITTTATTEITAITATIATCR